jgi:hypothetical protein
MYFKAVSFNLSANKHLFARLVLKIPTQQRSIVRSVDSYKKIFVLTEKPHHIELFFFEIGIALATK